MDLSDLPPSARERIAAAELEADSILANSQATAARYTAEAYLMGLDPSGIGYSPGKLPLDFAWEKLVGGHAQAAGHLFGATAGEYLKTGHLDIEGFNTKLDNIGGWIVQKYRIDRTVLDQLKQHSRMVYRRRRAAALEASEASKGTIIAKLPAEAFVRFHAETAAFLEEYLPKLKREANSSRPIHDAELLRELVLHQFNLVARECMAVCGSVAEFEAEVHSEIARFVLNGLSQYHWLADAMRKELESGFALFVRRADPWSEIPKKDRASVWHVGAITGEALTHAALKLRAEGWERAAAESDRKGRKRGPKSGHEAASRVAEIVSRVAPDGDWRPKLDDICEALDNAGIPFPQRWRKRYTSCHGWMDCDEPANAVKAIHYRLELTKQRKKTAPETLS